MDQGDIQADGAAATPAAADDRPPAPTYVVYDRPRCPACRSVRLLAQRSEKLDDDRVFRRVRCAGCGWAGALILI